jgi:hypothetical protein
MSEKELMTFENGKQILKAFYSSQTSNDTNFNFFKRRNARWIEILQWIKGSQKMSEFLDFMSVTQGEANKAYVPIDLEQSRIAAQFVGTLLQSMAKNRIYPSVKAVDDYSTTTKKDRFHDALYRMHDVHNVMGLTAASGMQLEQPNAYVPDDELAARVHFELQDQIPSEIENEQFLHNIQTANRFDAVLNRKTIFDLIALNVATVKIEKIAPENYTLRRCIGTNMVYNFFINETGECEVTQIGEFWNIKVKEFRTRFGKSASNPNGLDEKQIFELAKLSTNKSVGVFNFMWNNDWALTNFFQNRPYDDCNILVLDAEINCGHDVWYKETTDTWGRANVEQKQTEPYKQVTRDGGVIQQDKPDGVKVTKTKKDVWMRGVYAPYGDVMLYWNKADLIINPYTDTSKSLSSYTIIIPNNDGEYVPSLFERILEPLREYQLTKLERKKLIAQVRPAGIRIDIESARNIDLGNGNMLSWEEVVKIFNQTGVELYSSKGLDPLRNEPPPLSNTIHDESIEKIIGLTNILQSIVNEIRQLVGVPPSRDGSPLPSRTPAELAENQEQSSYNVSDFIMVANSELWEEVFRKLVYLHWNDQVKKADNSDTSIINTRFDVRIKMKMTDYEKQLLENDITRFSQMPDQNGRPLLSPKDALMLREIDNYKLACWYLDATVEKNRRDALAQSQQLQAGNAQVQQAAAQEKAKADFAMQQQELQAKKDMAEYQALQDMKVAIVQGSFGIATKGADAQFPQWLAPVIQQLVPGVTFQLKEENKQLIQGAAADAQQQADAFAQQQSGGAPPQQTQQQQPSQTPQMPQQ